MSKMYINVGFHATKEEVDCLIKDLGDNIASAGLIIKSDYAYHCNDYDYDGGLSILDRLNKKLNKYPESTIEDLKNSIRNSLCPGLEYMDVIYNMLTKEDIAYYGL